MRHTALSIAGSDCSGGAGIQADLKTMLANGVYGMTAVTALTAQNTTGVTDIMEVSPEFLGKQLDAVFTDIRPEAVKTGMVSSAALIGVIADRLKKYRADNIVVDPVMVSTSGSRLLKEDALLALQGKLFPLATLLTPNIPEAEILLGWSRGRIQSEKDMEEAAYTLGKTFHCAVLCKGGHQVNDANDVLYYENGIHVFRGTRIDNPNTHGTGCTLSSAITAYLARGEALENAVAMAKDYLSGTLSAMLDLGTGSGPLDHGYQIST